MSDYNYNTLCHHGIKGQKWGYRRYQNEDGTLTEAGKKRYRDFDEIGKRQFKKDQQSIKGQQLYEKGQTSSWLAYKSGLVSSAATIGSYAAYKFGQRVYNSAVFRGYATKGESIAMKACAGAIGAMAVGAIAYNVNAEVKRRQIRAYYANGNKQIVRIDKEKQSTKENTNTSVKKQNKIPKSPMDKAFDTWAKNNPNSDYDDFGDYLVDNKKLSDSLDTNQKKWEEKYGDAYRASNKK